MNSIIKDFQENYNNFYNEVIISKNKVSVEYFTEVFNKFTKEYSQYLSVITQKTYINMAQLLIISPNGDMESYYRKVLKYLQHDNYEVKLINDRKINVDYFDGVLQYNDIYGQKILRFKIGDITVDFSILTRKVDEKEKSYINDSTATKNVGKYVVDTEYKIDIQFKCQKYSEKLFNNIMSNF